MSSIMNSLYDMRLLEDLARKETSIHKIHPLIKLLTTVIYLFVTISFSKYEIISLLPLLFYPVIVFAFAELPLAPMLKRVLLVEPLIIGIGILNPFFDQQTIIIGGLVLSRGWITFLSIFIKCGLTVTAAILLLATTGMDKIAAALRMLKVPKVFVLQLLLTYRYISVLMEEVGRILRAYSLRAPKQKGVNRSAWGSLAGQLILRTFDRAQRVYQAMCLRGFTGEYNTGNGSKIKALDLVYMFVWILFFAVVRIWNIPILIGAFLTGVIR